MSKKYKVISMLALLLVFVTGCSFHFGHKKDEVKDPSVIFVLGDEQVKKGEVYIYVNSVRDSYGEILNELPEQAEDATSSDAVVEGVTREGIIKEIIRVKVLAGKASDYNVSLTVNEEDELKAKAKEFYSGLNDADRFNMEITEEIAYKVYYENELADRVTDKLLKDESLEISDEEARMTTFYDMYFQCYSVDAYGNVTPYTEEEKKEQQANAIEACSMLATSKIDNDNDAESIVKLAAYYNLGEAREYTITPERVAKIYGDEICDQIYMMQNGDYSTVIESEYGYHIFQMIALTDSKATAEYKELIKKQRSADLLSDKIEQWTKEKDKKFSYPESVNMEVYLQM